MVFSSKGKYLSEFPVDGPDHLCVDRKRGTVYVLGVSRSNIRNHGKEAWVRWKKKKLIKRKSWKDPKVLGELSLSPRGVAGHRPLIALDDEANARNAELISRQGTSPRVYVIPTDEERMIAIDTLEIVGTRAAA